MGQRIPADTLGSRGSRLMAPRVAHVVRRFGGVTEPFIAARIRADAGRELWAERLDAPADGMIVERVEVPWLRPGTAGDRLFHRVPSIGPPLAGAYADLERRRAPDVIHAHYLTTGWLIADRTRAPLVVSAYGFDATALGRRSAWRRAYARLARRVSAVVVEGPYMAGTLESLGFDRARVHIVPIAAALTEVAFRSPEPVGQRIRLVSCGRLVPKKGHELAIRAFAEAGLPANSTLTIVGDGPLRAALAELVARLGLKSSVELAGPLDRAAWLDQLRAHDLLVAASVTAPNGDQEGGAPTTILDAQAAGVPVVASRHCDIPFLVRDEATGYLAPEGSVSGLRDTLRRAVAGQADWPRIAAAARAQITQRHTDEIAAGMLQAIHLGVAAR
jgi:colanic acid/amylovoran biosynthesis glycosyltransferase